MNVLAAVAEKKSGFRSLAEPMIDTTSAHGKLITGILAVIGEFERSLIVARTGEGRKRAMANGIKFGRKPKLTPHQQEEALKRRADGESETAIARSFNVNQSTISRLFARCVEAYSSVDRPEKGGPW